MTHLFIEVHLEKISGIKDSDSESDFHSLFADYEKTSKWGHSWAEKGKTKNLPCPQLVCPSALSDFSLRFSEKVGIFVMCFLSGGWPIFFFWWSFPPRGLNKNKGCNGIRLPCFRGGHLCNYAVALSLPSLFYAFFFKWAFFDFVWLKNWRPLLKPESALGRFQLGAIAKCLALRCCTFEGNATFPVWLRHWFLANYRHLEEGLVASSRPTGGRLSKPYFPGMGGGCLRWTDVT